jgi:hypothetical protein
MAEPIAPNAAPAEDSSAVSPEATKKELEAMHESIESSRDNAAAKQVYIDQYIKHQQQAEAGGSITKSPLQRFDDL